MDLLFIAHCVPNPPNKGEKIRSYHQVHHLARRHNVHLACFAREDHEMEAAHQLSKICASVYVEKLQRLEGLMRGGLELAFGGCLNEGFYRSADMRQYVRKLVATQKIDITLAYAAVMHPYAPAGIPILLDMQDVDSEKWFDYARTRRPGMLYRLEAKRLREFERRCAANAAQTLLTTANEARLLESFSPNAATAFMENGIDGAYFDGIARPVPNQPPDRKFIAFVGTMDYHPNIEAALWFARDILPAIRRQQPDLEFLVIGRSPSSALLALHGKDGVVVTGGVPDIRPYLSSAQAIVTPLHLARGIQNKVLEALAMGRRVITSSAVCRTFGSDLPPGVIGCGNESEFTEAVLHECSQPNTPILSIREAACKRFSWSRNLEQLEETLVGLAAGGRAPLVRSVYA